MGFIQNGENIPLKYKNFFVRFLESKNKQSTAKKRWVENTPFL
jgi:hypothetical protein